MMTVIIQDTDNCRMTGEVTCIAMFAAVFCGTLGSLSCFAVFWCSGWGWPACPSGRRRKGSNQIVTPDLQPVGELSISAQGENSTLGNPQQLQMELGIAKTFEVAVFQGFQPSQTSAGVEVGLYHRGPYLLSAGVLSLQNHVKCQPFVEGGYYRGKAELIAGVQHQCGANIPVLGAAYQLTPTVQPMVDYQGGAANYATAGVTFTLAPNLTFNPAVYISNSRPHRSYAYGVMSWNVKVW